MNKFSKVVFIALLALMATAAFAQGTAVVPAGDAVAVVNNHWPALLGSAFVLGVAAAAGAIGQGKAIAAACEGIARNPGAAGPIRLAMLIGLALIESLVIYALVFAFVAVGK